MRISYKTDKQGWSETQCPHANFILRVGSQLCQQCKYWFGQNSDECCVHCLCPDGEMLKILPK